MTTHNVAGTVCPDCKSPVAVRLLDGRSCPQCESSKAWERYGAGRKLVIGKRELAEAEARLAGDETVSTAAAMHWMAGLVGIAMGVAGAWFARGLFDAQPLGPLVSLQGAVARIAQSVTGLGFVALVLGVFATLRQKRGALFRNVPLLIVNLSAVLLGVGGFVVGAFHWAGTGAFGWEHVSMPPLVAAKASPSLTPQEQSIMSATTVLLAPDGEGDARGLSVGSGAVIRSDARTAFVVTCSHVAMPYKTVAAYRDPRDAYPVWVYFSDGRHSKGTVVWTAEPPLDVAVVRVDIDDPPLPVPVRVSADAADEGFAVSFVPNPFRSGWMIHRGEVMKREPHRTPAGDFSLIYTSLPVQPGDSGTGLFDSLGRLVGLNTWTRFEEGGPKGISLPSNTMERIVRMMDDNELDIMNEGEQGLGGGR